ncbi:DUF7289 family protein [Halorubellus litoreus]|uniref:DUF7305 domain-containing protein n=2 Tax=Halorubellus litoreus TaxID=755308 RepID=A0ABD5VEH8_9EURY
MMGFVAAASVSLFVVGTATVDQTRDTAQENQVENTFRQFNKDVSSVAFGRQKYRSMEFDIQDQTAAFRQENTGQIRVVVDGTEIVNKQVGSLVYEKSGETIAYQAGGVWRGTGEESRMVSRPPVEYQNGSLTFPIPALDGDESVQAGQVDINKMKTESPINNVGFVEGKLVTLYITSKYYQGWAQYFRTQTNDVAVEVDHSPAGDVGTVKVKLGKPVANGDFEDGVMATGGDDGDISMGNGDPGINGPVAATGDIDDPGNDISGTKTPNKESDLYELDEAIDRKVDEVSSDGSVITVNPESGGASLGGGNTYYDPNGFSLSDSGDDIVVDLSSGNVTLVVDGDMELTDGDIKVKNAGGTDYAFRIYSTGDFGMKNAFAGDYRDETSGHSASSAQHFQVYGTSEMLVGLQGGSTRFVGTIYAPRNEPALEDDEGNHALPSSEDDCEGWDVCVYKGSSAVKGAIVAGPTKFEQSAGMTYDTSLTDIQPTLELDDGVLPPPITFLKVSVHTVGVNNSGAGNLAPAGGLGASASVASPPTTATGFATVTAPSGVVAAPAVRAETGFDR